jgi:hypothetical protein
MSSLYILYVKHLISDSRTKSLYVHIVDLIHVPHLDKNNPMRTISCYAYLSGYLSISLKNNGTIEDASILICKYTVKEEMYFYEY